MQYQDRAKANAERVSREREQRSNEADQQRQQMNAKADQQKQERDMDDNIKREVNKRLKEKGIGEEC